MEVELKIDVTTIFSYEAIERALGETWDPVTRVFKDEDVIYAEEVAEDMVADVPVYTPLPPSTHDYRRSHGTNPQPQTPERIWQMHEWQKWDSDSDTQDTYPYLYAIPRRNTEHHYPS